MTDINIDERLCLSQADGIYVNCSKLLQHQIDALRFLYAQFKKKRAGVIYNDPSGYGKTVVVVLFLQAIRKLLQAPALVLSRAGELQHWRHHFHAWSTTDDVIFESSNPYVKKSVFVNSRQQLPALARRTWSVVVVDDELNRELQADYKIYITNEDMKDNLFTFSSIHKWLYPKEEFDINLFTANKNNPVDVDRKSVMVDFFFEDIVFRSKKITPPPFSKPEIKEIPAAIEPPRISRKNKDATGTKIKRSKARIEAEHHAAKLARVEPENHDKVPKVETENHAKVARVEPESHAAKVPEKNATITSKDYYKDKEMDVESFIRNEKPITGEGVEEFLDFQVRSETDLDRNVNGTANNDVCTADYQKAINDIVNNENDIKKGNEDIEDTIEKEEKDTGIERDKETSNNKNVDLEDKIETIQVNNGSNKDLDAKLLELEEKTMKKFKGSLLDSIF